MAQTGPHAAQMDAGRQRLVTHVCRDTVLQGDPEFPPVLTSALSRSLCSPERRIHMGDRSRTTSQEFN